jgi:hypothetical protein
MVRWMVCRWLISAAGIGTADRAVGSGSYHHGWQRHGIALDSTRDGWLGARVASRLVVELGPL